MQNCSCGNELGVEEAQVVVCVGHLGLLGGRCSQCCSRQSGNEAWLSLDSTLLRLVVCKNGLGDPSHEHQSDGGQRRS